MKKIISTSLLFMVILSLYSQSGSELSSDIEKRDLITDRPDQTESSVTVPKNALQIESGFMLEMEETNLSKSNNWGLGTTLLRYGVWDNFELRIGSFYQTSNITIKGTDADSSFQGFGPLIAGFKVYVVEEQGIRPEISIMADITMRHVGHEEISPTYSYPTAKILASHTLSPKFSMGYNAGFAYNGENADGFFVYSYVIGYSITEKLGSFAEVYGNFDNGDLPNHKVDGGLTYLVADNFQLDISAGMGFDDVIDKNFVSMGFSWRIPK